MKIAFQGEPGAFSDDAARRLVPGATTVGFATFDEAAAAVQAGAVQYALLPVENSIAGSVPRVYDLLWSDLRLSIVDEIVYRIVQHLIGVPGSTIPQLREIRSHAVALEQCRRFLSQLEDVRATIVADTAGAVREVMQLSDPTIAAIGSTSAADRYGGRILASTIQDVAENFTRFFLLQRDAPERVGASHACVALSLDNHPGSLGDALNAFAEEGLDLRTLVSRPSLERPFSYRFYCEIAPVDRAKLERALARIEGEPRILGLY